MRELPLAEVLGRIRRGVLLALVAGLPLVFLWDVTNLPYEAPKLALLVIAVSIAAALRVAELLLGAPPGGLRRAALPAAFVVVPVAISWAATDYRSWALLGSYGRYEGLVPTVLVVIAGVLLADGFGGAFRPVAWALAASAGLTGLYALVQSLGLDPLDVPVIEYVPSTVGHSNFLGGFLAVALPVCLGLWVSSAGPARYAAIACTLGSALGILFSFSQGGWIAAAAGLAVFAGGQLVSRHRLAPAAGWVVAGGLAAAVAGLVLFSLVQPFHSVVPATARARGLWWRGAVSMGAESPVWGRGPNVYSVEGPHHRNAEDALAHDRTYADEPHSVPLGRFANQGLLGLGGFVALLVWTVRRSRRALESPVAYGCAAGAAAYFAQSLVSIDALVLTLPLWVCLAALVPSREETAPARPRRAGAFAVALALVGVVTVGAVWWSARFLVNDAHVFDALEDFGDRRTEAALATFEDVLSERDDEHYRHVYGSILGVAALRERDEGGDEIAHLKEVFSFVEGFPDVRALASYGDALHQWSVYDPALESDALVQLERVLELDEFGPTTRVWAAEALIRLDRASEAAELLEEMVPLIEELPEYSGTHPKLWGALAIAYFHDDRTADAEDALDSALAAGDVTADTSDCHVLVASELLRTGGRGATRDELTESSPGLLLCKPATLAVLPGWEPQEDG